jgi:hypothetical protein
LNSVLYHSSHSTSPFLHFWDRTSIHVQPAWPDPPSYASHIAGVAGMCLFAQPLVEMGALNLFAGLVSNLNPSDLLWSS